jgi:hypothetical protein
MTDLTAEDRRRLERAGISEEEAHKQLELLRHPPAPTRVDRPCTVGDGIHSIDEKQAEELIERHDAAAREGRFTKFVPASGAASRMFKSLTAHLERLEAGEAPAPSEDARRLAEEGPRFAFWDELVEKVRELGGDPSSPDDLVRGLLREEGLGLGDEPKGLIPFHRYPDGPRTAFAEHLFEAPDYVRDSRGLCRAGFTVPPERRAEFERRLDASREPLRARHDSELEVSFSVQEPSTDTIAIGEDGAPFRLSSGELLLRPGGHGALLGNLERLRADCVMIKNIDNVLPESKRGGMIRWKKLLAGFLLAQCEQVRSLLLRLEREGAGGEAGEAAAAFLARRFGVDLDRDLAAARDADSRAELLRDRLDRPVRVCGMVENRGEPGGGPFWADDGAGHMTPQIVETAQIDLDDPTQKAALDAATHFNPVDIACAVRDHRGQPFALGRFIDESTYIVASKSAEGRPLRALERPGLWNGAMAGWNTIFVEIPAETFAPVKTVFDLLRPEHQPD